MANTFVADPAVASRGSMLVNQIEVDQKPLPTSNGSLMQVTVGNRANHHETAVVVTKLESTQVDVLKDKTIAFTYGPRANLGTFYGYVNSVVASKDYQEDGVYDIVCFGTTSPLQDGKPRFFVGKTVPQMATEIIADYRLGLQTDESSFAWPTFAQTDETDWAFLVNAASTLGWSLYNYNGAVRLTDPARILNDTGPVLRLIRGNEANDQSRQLLDFQPGSDSVNVASLLTPVFGYFDGVKPVISHAIEKGYRIYTDSPVLNRSMAELNAKAWDSNPTSWTQKATGRIRGNPSVIPGTVVDVQTSGSSVVQHDYDGLWLVDGVTHVATAKSFQTGLSLVRDDKVRKSNVDYRPFWMNSPQGRPQVVRKGDVWESSWKAVSTVSSSLTPVSSSNSNYEWKAT